VRKQTTAVYAKDGRNLLFKCVTMLAKVGQGRPKCSNCISCLTCAILPKMNVLAQVIGVYWNRKNRKVSQSVLTFLPRSRSPIPSTRKTIPSYMTLHDNVAVAVIVSEILRRAPKVCRGACDVTLSPCKISSQSVPICRSYSRKK